MAAQFVRNIRVPPVAPITRKKILVLGSGRVCNPVIQYINKITEYQVTIGKHDIYTLATLVPINSTLVRTRYGHVQLSVVSWIIFLF